MFLAQSFPRGRHLPRPVAVCASRIAVAGAPTGRPNRSAVDLAEGRLAWMDFSDGFPILHWHATKKPVTGKVTQGTSYPSWPRRVQRRKPAQQAAFSVIGEKSRFHSLTSGQGF